jgi:hypothetical protein
VAGRAVTRLTEVDFWTWLGLRRVDRGGLAQLGTHYLDRGRPMPGFLVPDLVEALTEAGFVELGTPDLDTAGMRPVLTVRIHALDPVDVQADTGAQGTRAVSTPGEDPAVATFEWLALRRALRGELSTMAGRYVHHGRPVLREVADVLDQLIQTGRSRIVCGERGIGRRWLPGERHGRDRGFRRTPGASG